MWKITKENKRLIERVLMRLWKGGGEVPISKDEQHSLALDLESALADAEEVSSP